MMLKNVLGKTKSNIETTFWNISIRMEPYEIIYIYIKCCAKGFFSEISILDNKWLLKIAKKMRKCVFLFTGLELEIVLEFRPPLFFDFRGGHTSSILSKSCSFLRYAFLELEFIIQNNDFWEKSLYYSSFYT